MRAEQDHINATASNEDHYQYFIKVVQEASAELALLKDRNNVIVDRYWMTTVVYHRVMGIAAKLEDMGEIIMPDLTVYLSVSPEIQAARMISRGMSPGDIRMYGCQHLLRQAYEEVIAGRSDVIVIDTSALSVDQVIRKVLDFVKLPLVRSD